MDSCPIGFPPPRTSKVCSIDYILEQYNNDFYLKYKKNIENKERLILYMLVSLFSSIIGFLLVLTARLLHQKRQTKKRIRAEQMVVTPFDPIDFDDDDDDDDDDLNDHHGDHLLDGVTTMSQPEYGRYQHSPRHYRIHVPQNMPTVSMMAANSKISRASTYQLNPFLYSTIDVPMGRTNQPPLETINQFVQTDNTIDDTQVTPQPNNDPICGGTN